MNIYLICPVRSASPESKQMAERYVRNLESQGHKVHYPPRDVDQTDDGCGLRICEAHRKAMVAADEVHVIWKSDSVGSHFDLGMAYMLQYFRPNIKFVAVDWPKATLNKSYTNVLLKLSGEFGIDGDI